VNLSSDQQTLCDAIALVCRRFGDDYWSACDRDARFPTEFHRAMADGGWLGLTVPEAYGGSGLSLTDACLMMHTIAVAGGGMAAASSIHINMFGPHPIIVHGTAEQKQRWLPNLVSGVDQVCFGVTEPDAGLDTASITTFATKVPGGYRVSGRKIWTSTAQVATKIMLLARTTARADVARPTDGMTIFYTDLDRTKIDVRRIDKHGRAAVDSNMVFIDDYFVPDKDRVGAEGSGFSAILDSLNPERILIAAEAIGIGRCALNRAAAYARERRVFGRPIGQNQSIQHPLAECWLNLEAAWLMTRDAAARYDTGLACGPQANGQHGLPASRADPWRHGVCQGIPRGTVAARGADHAACAGQRAIDLIVHRRESLGSAQIVLKSYRFD
jgi:acyl-CoA dehydrogenase